MMKQKLATILFVPIFLSACASASPEQRGAATGAGVGALIGAAATSLISSGDGKSTRRGAAIGAVAGAIAGFAWTEKLEKQKRDLQEATEGSGIEVSQTEDNRLKIDIPSDISFDVNKSYIKHDFEPLLDQFARSLQDNHTTLVTVVGHTDSTGNDAINNPLSVDRAASTREYLASRGVDFRRIAIDGRGSHEPIADNTTDTGRSMNRRIEIFVAQEQAQRQ